MIKTFCEDALKARIEIKGNEPPTLISTNPPVTVEQIQKEGELVGYSGQVGTPCYTAPAWLSAQSPAVWIWNDTNASPKADTEEIAIFNISFESLADQLFDLVVACDNKAEIFLNGDRIATVSSFSEARTLEITGIQGNNNLVFRCINTPIGTIDPIANPAGLYFRLQKKGTCRLTITDSSGEIFDKSFPKCPKYTVACNDDCPAGYLKCSSNKYPGYCCLHCQQTANKIRALGNKLV